MADRDDIAGRDTWRKLGQIEAALDSNHEAIERIGTSLTSHVNGCHESNVDVRTEMTALRGAVEAQGLSIVDALEDIGAMVTSINAIERVVTDNARVVSGFRWVGKQIVERVLYLVVGALIIWGIMSTNILPAGIKIAGD